MHITENQQDFLIMLPKEIKILGYAQRIAQNKRNTALKFLFPLLKTRIDLFYLFSIILTLCYKFILIYLKKLQSSLSLLLLYPTKHCEDVPSSFQALKNFLFCLHFLLPSLLSLLLFAIRTTNIIFNNHEFDH